MRELMPRSIKAFLIMAADRAIDDQRFVAATEQMAEELVPPVAAAGVGAQKRFHSSDQIRPRRLDHQMKMIRQEDVGMEPASRSWRPPRRGFRRSAGDPSETEY